jgi:hypothetical protein
MREFIERFAAFLRKSGHESDLDAEMKAHLAFAIDENIAAGMTAAEARRRALIRFGGVEAAKELHRETRSFVFLEHLTQDLQHALRMMRRDPGFSLFAILIIALGIGASTTVFSVLRTVLIRPLPFRDAAKLVWLANSKPDGANTAGAAVSRSQRAQSLLFGYGGVFCFLRSGRQSAYREWRIGTAQRATRLAEFLSHARRATAAGP